MSALNDGGPAFPVADVQASEPETVAQMRREARGMSLRDYFAAKAMVAMIPLAKSPQDAKNVCVAAYAAADAMLKAREVQP